MFKSILLCTDGSPAAEGAGEYARWLARRCQAKILALHVTDIRLLEGPWLADLAGAIGAQPYPALLAQVKAFQAARGGTILESVADRCRQGGVVCETAYAVGALVHTLLQHESRADLVVLGRQGEHAAWQAGQLGSSVERLVRGSTKPCLVTPEQFREPRRLLIAHDGSDESTKALYQGLNLAVLLEAGVTLVTACQLEQEDAAARVLQQAKELALARSLKVHAQLVHDNADQAILKLAGEADADLIVMGAYGHTRVREWILGSTTSHVLRKTALPVYLARE